MGGKNFVGVNYCAMNKYKGPKTKEQWDTVVKNLKVPLDTNLSSNPSLYPLMQVYAMSLEEIKISRDMTTITADSNVQSSHLSYWTCMAFEIQHKHLQGNCCTYTELDVRKGYDRKLERLLGALFSEFLPLFSACCVHKWCLLTMAASVLSMT